VLTLTRLVVAAPNASVTIAIDWIDAAASVHQEPSGTLPVSCAVKSDMPVTPSVCAYRYAVQVVSQHFLFPGSPIFNESWASLAALQARRVRFAAWFPYARVMAAATAARLRWSRLEW
jgi:hypothetical protein